MNHRNDGGRSTETSTGLYLVRIWRGRQGDGAPSLHGKLQHTVSGAFCYFDELSSLPEVLGKMMEQEAGATSPGADIERSDGPDGDLDIR